MIIFRGSIQEGSRCRQAQHSNEQGSAWVNIVAGRCIGSRGDLWAKEKGRGVMEDRGPGPKLMTVRIIPAIEGGRAAGGWPDPESDDSAHITRIGARLHTA